MSHGRAVFSIVVLIAVTAALLPAPATALHGSGSAVVKDVVFSLLEEPFGLLRGGQLSVRLSTGGNVPDLYFLACSAAEISYINSNFNSALALCDAIETVSCTVNAPVANGSLSVEAEAPRKDVYYLLLANCDMRTVDLRFSYELMNPNGEQLPYGQIPLPRAFVALSIAWAFVLTLWALNALRFFYVHIRLHRLLGASGAVKACSALAAAWYWASLSRQGTVPLSQSVVYKVAALCARVLGVAVLLLVSHGYCVTLASLDAQLVRMVLVTLAAVAAVSAGSLFLGGYFLFFVLVVYVLLFRHVFGAIIGTFRTLQRQLRTVAAGGIDPQTSPIARKLALMESAQGSVIVWIFGVVAANVVGTFFWAELAWIGTIGSETADLLLFVVLAWLYRLRDFSRYEVSSPEPRALWPESSDDSDHDAAPGDAAAFDAVLVAARNVDVQLPMPAAEGLRPWQPGMALPNNPGFSLVDPVARGGLAVALFPLASASLEDQRRLRDSRSSLFALAEIASVNKG